MDLGKWLNDQRKDAMKDLTAKDVAQLLAVGPEWVRDRCNDGTFPNAYRLADGGPWRIPREDVDAWRIKRRSLAPRPPQESQGHVSQTQHG